LKERSAELPRTLIYSVSTHDILSGSVYVEAETPQDVRQLLQGIGNVVSVAGAPRMEQIPPDEYIQLLEMGEKRARILVKKYDWVRIKQGNVLAVVKAVNDAESSCTVIFSAPQVEKRLEKRKASRGGALESREEVISVSAQQVEKRLGKRKASRDGALEFREEVISVSDVIQSGVVAAWEELDLFRCSQDEAVVNALLNKPTLIAVGQRVRIVKGAQAGIEGRVTDITDYNTIVIKDTATQLDIQVLVTQVKKKFEAGDYVRITLGPSRDFHGFITRLDESIASIFNPKTQSAVRRLIL
jgi:transcription antitermination factor NusG